MSKLNIKLRDSLGRFKKVRFNLLTGIKPIEVFSRKAMFVIGAFMIVALVGMLFIDKPTYEEYIGEFEEVEAVEEVEDTIKWVDGNRITEKADGTVEVVPEEIFNPKSEGLEKIESFVLEGYPGSRIDREYLDLLEDYCDEDTLRVVVGISVAESGMGKAVNRQSNFFGWFKGGDRNYDPSQEEMAQEICRGVKKSYMSIGKDGSVTSVYTGNDRSGNWSKNFNWAIDQMK